MAGTLGPRGRALIKSYEELHLVAYKPTPNDKWTIGWGHTRGVRPGDTCTETQAEEWFLEDTAEARRAVDALPVKLTPAMYDALVSLVYNTGAGAVEPKISTIGEALVRRDYYTACSGLFAWRKQTSKATGKRENLLGLARRRVEEMALFLADGMP